MPEEVSGSGFPSPELAVSNVGDVCWQLPEDWGSLFFGIQPDCLNVTFLVLKFCLHLSSFHTHSMTLCCQSVISPRWCMARMMWLKSFTILFVYFQSPLSFVVFVISCSFSH